MEGAFGSGRAFALGKLVENELGVANSGSPLADWASARGRFHQRGEYRASCSRICLASSGK